jgi:hypothetical protein
VHEPEGGERQALDHDLHAEVGDVPPLILEDGVKEPTEVRVDRVVAGKLLVGVPLEDLDVPGLVDHLGRCVVLPVDPGDLLDDLGRAEERSLLAVEELGENGVLLLDLEVQPVLVVPAGELGAVLGRLGPETGRLVAAHGPAGELLLVDLGVPGKIRRGVPLRDLRLLIQAGEGVPIALVVPGKSGAATCVHVMDRAQVAPARRQDGVDLSFGDGGHQGSLFAACSVGRSVRPSRSARFET